MNKKIIKFKADNFTKKVILNKNNVEPNKIKNV